MKPEVRLQFIVLYVDDDEGNRVVFEQTFSPSFTIRVAASGREALEILASTRVAVLVADQRMPEMSGNELLRRAKELYPDVVRMVLTAYSDLDPILRAVNDGLVARYVIKPWMPDELERMLAWGVDAFRMGTEYAEAQLRLLELERLATLGSIHAAIVHDISQPASYLTNNTERLKVLATSTPALRRLVQEGPSWLAPRDRANLMALAGELADICNDMSGGCALICELVHSVRRLLKPKTGEPEVLLDPAPTIRFALSVCNRALMHVGATLATDCPQSLPGIGIGNGELAQVLINLVSNAAQALGRSERRGRCVEVRVRDDGPRLSFCVQDNGPGMAPDVLRRVGTPFFSTRPDGTGLGVSQARRVVEGVKGTIVIESQEGVGTTINFTIPKIGAGIGV
jgi:signal transduction histidine kinase